jgi:hypothetical protein
MDVQQIMEMLKAMQEKADADRTKDREILLAMRQEMNANTKAMQELQDLKSDQAKMIAAFKEKTDAWIANIKDAQKKTTASLKATETKPDSGKMQSVEEHQGIPKEDAEVMPVGGLRKRCRDRNLAAGRHQKPNRRIQATCESRRILIVACKKITRHATVAWSKRNVLRKIVTQGNYGPRKTLTVTGRKTTSRATGAWHSENIVRKDCTREQAKQETQKRRKEEGLWKGKECNSGTRNRGLRQHVRRRMRIRNLCGRRPLYLRNEEKTSGIYKMAIVLETAKQIVGTPSGLRKLRKWTLWRGRLPPKRKKSSCTG